MEDRQGMMNERRLFLPQTGLYMPGPSTAAHTPSPISDVADPCLPS